MNPLLIYTIKHNQTHVCQPFILKIDDMATRETNPLENSPLEINPGTLTLGQLRTIARGNTPSPSPRPAEKISMRLWPR